MQYCYTEMFIILIEFCFYLGFQNHGRNFEAVSKFIDSKNVTQVKNFFFNYKRKYNLLKHVSDYETRNVRYLNDHNLLYMYVRMYVNTQHTICDPA